MREGGRLAGARPVSIATLKHSPKKVFDVRPSFSPLPLTVRGSGSWTGEVLLDQRGGVTHVWPIHEPRLTSPVPAFNAAIVDAVRQWRFEPVLVNAQPAPACLLVTVSIDWP
jgi:hypothetical protein